MPDIGFDININNQANYTHWKWNSNWADKFECDDFWEEVSEQNGRFSWEIKVSVEVELKLELKLKLKLRLRLRLGRLEASIIRLSLCLFWAHRACCCLASLASSTWKIEILRLRLASFLFMATLSSLKKEISILELRKKRIPRELNYATAFVVVRYSLLSYLKFICSHFRFEVEFEFGVEVGVV